MSSKVLPGVQDLMLQGRRGPPAGSYEVLRFVEEGEPRWIQGAELGNPGEKAGSLEKGCQPRGAESTWNVSNWRAAGGARERESWLC